MALNTLNLTNTRTTAKPVNGKKGGKLNAIMQALGSAEQITTQQLNREVVKKEEDLVQDQQLDASNILFAKENKQDLNTVDIKTDAGVDFKNELVTSDIINKSSREAQIKTAKEGGDFTDTVAYQRKAYTAQLDALGTQEEKDLLTKKQVSLGRQYSQNEFSQVLAKTKEQRNTDDFIAASNATKRTELTTAGSKKIWDKNNALQDATNIGNKSAEIATSENLSSAEQIEYVKNNFAVLIKKNANNKEYVLNMVAQRDLIEKTITAQGASKILEETKRISSDTQQGSVANTLANWNSPNTVSQGLGNILNSKLESGQVSVTNAKNGALAQIKEWTMNNQEIPQSFMDFLEADRPGTNKSGWLYTDSAFSSAVRANKTSTKINSEGTSSSSIAQAKINIDEAIKNKALTTDMIDRYEATGDITKRGAGSLKVQLHKQEVQKDVDLKLANVYSSSGLERKAFLDNFDKEDNTTKLNSVNAIMDSVRENNPEFIKGFTGTINDPSIKMALQLAKDTGFVDDGTVKMFNVDFDSENFASNAELLSSITDSEALKYVRASISEEHLNDYDNYTKLMSINNEYTKPEIDILLSNTKSLDSGYNSKFIEPVEYDAKTFNKDLNKSLDNITDVNTSWYGDISQYIWGGSLDFNNKGAVSELIGKKYNQLSILNPDMSPDTKWAKARNYISESFVSVDGVLISNNNLLPKDKLTTDIEPEMEKIRSRYAYDLLGDADRSDEIGFVRTATTEKDGLYNIIEKKPDGSIGRTYGQTLMMDKSKGDHRSVIDSINFNLTIENAIKQRSAQVKRQNNKGYKGNFFGTDAIKNFDKREHNEFSKLLKREINEEYVEEDIVNSLMTSPNFIFEPSKNEKASGSYNFKHGSELIDIERDDFENIELRKNLAKESVKRTRNLFNKKDYKGYFELNPASKNKLIWQYLTRTDKTLSAEDLFNKEKKHVDELADLLYSPDPEGEALRNEFYKNASRGNYHMFNKLNHYIDGRDYQNRNKK